MTNKGMAAINEALTVVEKVPTTYSTSGESVPITTILILKFILEIVKHAQDNQKAICDMLNDVDEDKKIKMSEAELISIYVGNVCYKHAEVLSKLAYMPPRYPLERMTKLISNELNSLNAKAERVGFGPL